MKNFVHFYYRTLLFIMNLSLLVVLIVITPGKLHAQSSAGVKENGFIGFLPGDEAFDPFLADPRWPHFSASLQINQEEDQPHNIGSANMGTSFALYGCKRKGGIWQIGLQAGVFSIFDLDAPSKDLVNSDFRVALPLSVRYGAFSTQARIYHQSSHVGDEFLLHNKPERMNLSYEGIDLMLSLDLGRAMRIYGGGGRLINTSPSREKYSVHGGLEIVSPNPLFGSVYPLAALDIQSFEELEWKNNYSVQAGFKIGGHYFAKRQLMVVFEYYNGHSPNGQFYELKMESYGGGIHFFY